MKSTPVHFFAKLVMSRLGSLVGMSQTELSLMLALHHGSVFPGSNIQGKEIKPQ